MSDLPLWAEQDHLNLLLLSDWVLEPESIVWLNMQDTHGKWKPSLKSSVELE
jgi:hypothetical protein